MTKDKPKMKDINGTPICIGDTIAIVETCSYRSAPQARMITGTVSGFTGTGVRYTVRPKMTEYAVRTHSKMTVLIIEGEYVRNGKIIAHDS